MLIAESPQIDPAAIIAILIAVALALLAAATVIGLAGTWVGRRLARRGLGWPAPDRAPRRRRVWLSVGGIGAAAGSWMVLGIAVPAIADGLGAGALLLAGLPAPVAWGFWTESNGRWRAEPPTGPWPPGDPT